MPDDLRIASAQFENRSGDKQFNLAAIERLSARAARLGADVVAFHECSITGYSFARRLSRQQLWDLAETIPGGASVEALGGIARRHGVAVLAGLFERGDDGEIYKAHVCVDSSGLIATRANESRAAAVLPAVCGRRVDRRAVRPTGHHAIL